MKFSNEMFSAKNNSNYLITNFYGEINYFNGSIII